MNDNLENIKIVEFNDGTEDYVAMFNDTRVNEEEVNEAINLYPMYSENPDVIFMTYYQYYNVFKR